MYIYEVLIVMYSRMTMMIMLIMIITTIISHIDAYKAIYISQCYLSFIQLLKTILYVCEYIFYLGHSLFYNDNYDNNDNNNFISYRSM